MRIKALRNASYIGCLNFLASEMVGYGVYDGLGVEGVFKLIVEALWLSVDLASCDELLERAL